MNKQEIMKAAWAIFRETYHYPAVPFRSLGRKCFGWALSEAYRRARAAARIAAIPVEIKTARIAELQAAREIAGFMSSYRQSQARVAEIDAELSRLEVAA